MGGHWIAGRIARAGALAMLAWTVSFGTAIAAPPTRSSPPAAAGVVVPPALPVFDGFIHEQGVRLHVHSVGGLGGTTVVLIHGGPGLTLQTTAFFDAIAGPQRRVVSYDQRGAGRSSKPANKDYSLAAQLGDLDAVRRWAGAPTVTLIGHSWGGILAAAYTAEHPTHVTALVLVDAVPLNWQGLLAGFANRNARVAALQRQGLIPAVLPSVTHNSCLALVDALTPAYLADPRAPIPPSVLWGPSCTASASSRSVNSIAARPSQLTTLASMLKGWHGRGLVLEGDRDPFGLAWLRLSLSELRGTKSLEPFVVPFAGHFPWAERPTLVLETVKQFLE